jgi:type II secretory pathway pseudopilin PulG
VPKLERDLENALRAAAQAQAQAQAAAAAQAFDNVGANSTLIADGDTANSSTNSSSGTNSGNYPPSNAPRITDPPKELVQWLRRALGGKKHRKVAASYALNLCQSLGANPNLPVEAVVRNSRGPLRCYFFTCECVYMF